MSWYEPVTECLCEDCNEAAYPPNVLCHAHEHEEWAKANRHVIAWSMWDAATNFAPRRRA